RDPLAVLTDALRAKGCERIEPRLLQSAGLLVLNRFTWSVYMQTSSLLGNVPARV
uniref:YcaO domain-containing protein n=1 Tax=Parascaris univalens TaxID=6257 RepID=A0A915AQP4_PARUN